MAWFKDDHPIIDVIGMIQLSKAAIAEIKRLKASQGNMSAYLEIGVKPGGCSQFHYVLEFGDEAAPGDRVVEIEGLSIVIRKDNLPRLEGVSVDYSEDLMGGGFRFNNPNAIQSCGCGNSFASDVA